MADDVTTIQRPPNSASPRHAVAIALLVAWLPAAILTLSTKYRLLNPRGFQAVSDQLRWSFDPHRDPATYFSYLDCLCLMRADVTIAWAVIPALLFFVTRRLRPGLAAAVVAGCSTAVTLLLFVQNRCLSVVGSFVTAGMLREALDWAVSEPRVASPYLLAAPNLKLLLGCSLIVGAAVAAVRWAARVVPSWMSARRSWLTLLPGFALTLVAWYPAMPSTSAHNSAIVSATTVLFGLEENDPGTFAGMSQEALAQHFREMTNSPDVVQDRQHRGLAKGFDVIIFVLETAPYRCVPISDLPLADFETLTRLSANSFVAPHHYTTYPNTTCAVFSLLSGLYPMSRDAFRLTASNGTAPGLATSLRRGGYETTLYSAVELSDADRQMFGALGFDAIILGTDAELGGKNKRPLQNPYSENVQRRIAMDRRILDVAQHDRERCAKANRRYLHVLMPQIGHAPWADLTGDGGSDVYRQGRALCALQDRWLGEIVQHLETLGRLDQTLFVVVGDHGTRSRLEDPALHLDTMEDVTFHVPLLVYCGKSLREKSIVRERTSHIDLSPTLLELMGKDDDLQFSQGVPIWRATTSRKLFFWAREIKGFDGFVSDREFCMYRPGDALVLSGLGMNSDGFHRAGQGSVEYTSIVDRISAMRALQGQWTRNALAKGWNHRVER